MPTDDRASNKPTNNNNARTVLLITLRNDKSLPVADLSKRDFDVLPTPTRCHDQHRARRECAFNECANRQERCHRLSS